MLTALSAEAFSNRALVQKTPRLSLPDGRVITETEAHVAHVNALRILDTSLIHAGDTILCLLPMIIQSAKLLPSHFPLYKNCALSGSPSGGQKCGTRHCSW